MRKDDVHYHHCSCAPIVRNYSEKNVITPKNELLPFFKKIEKR